jgi:IclR family pca regulon transcriptional regulator
MPKQNPNEVFANGDFDPKSIVNSVAKAFAVLQAFTHLEPELTLADVTKRTGLNKGTSFRFLNTLAGLGYLVRNPQDGRYRLSLKCVDLGLSAIARMDLRSLAEPLLRGLVSCGGTNAASIGMLDGTDIIFLHRIQTATIRLTVDIHVGMRLPAYCTSLGQAILAYLPDDQATDILNQTKRIQRTPQTLVSISDLKKRLIEVRNSGLAIHEQESTPGLRAIAAPIFGHSSSPIAAISLATLTTDGSSEAFLKLAKKPVLDAAEQLTRAIQAGGGMIANPSSRRFNDVQDLK